LRAFVSGGAGHRDDGERDLLGRKALAFAEREVEEEEEVAVVFLLCWGGRMPRAALSRSSSSRPTPSSMLVRRRGGEGGGGRLVEVGGGGGAKGVLTSSMSEVGSCGVGAGAMVALLEDEEDVAREAPVGSVTSIAFWSAGGIGGREGGRAGSTWVGLLRGVIVGRAVTITLAALAASLAISAAAVAAATSLAAVAVVACAAASSAVAVRWVALAAAAFSFDATANLPPPHHFSVKIKMHTKHEAIIYEQHASSVPCIYAQFVFFPSVFFWFSFCLGNYIFF